MQRQISYQLELVNQIIDCSKETEGVSCVSCMEELPAWWLPLNSENDYKKVSSYLLTRVLHTLGRKTVYLPHIRGR